MAETASSKAAKGNHPHVNYHRPIVMSIRSSPLLDRLAEKLSTKFFKNDGLENAFSIMKPKIKSFSNGEFLTHVSESVRDGDVYILVQPRNEEHLINTDIAEMHQLIRSCRVGMAYRVNLLLPCMPYARQDRSTRDREFPSFRLFCDHLKVSGVDTVTTLELHNDATVGYMEFELSNNSTLSFLAHRIAKRIIDPSPGMYHLIAPDTGSAKYIERLRTELGKENHGGHNLQYSIVQKHRDPSSGETSIAGFSTPAGVDLRGSKCIMVDDMVDTGGTAAQAARYLYDKMGVSEVSLIATHGIFSKSAREKLQAGGFKQVCVTDTCPIPANMKAFPELMVWSVDHFLAGLVYNIHNGKSNIELVGNVGEE